MHEMSIALAVIDQVESAVRPAGATAVSNVRLQIGELAGVVPDALAFSFQLACEGTVLAGAELITEPIAARARCAACDRTWPAGMPPRLSCPGCGGARVELLSGRELRIADVSWHDAPVPTPTHEER
ncbi:MULTISPECIES: hydrogenase maturation nickel metallochaperone HypA [Streptomyces]|uniref:Hydrogenase maturation factor HypA n=2 Tax=Streptomyces TaxID=1883 RepID=A0A2N8P8Z7_STRNR|nr:MULTISPECIES: hydrogenase maturation nickel metallochaperone HypA [Streptomyces]PNE37499.1 hydrogenase nickel incorporation protein HypA [Streptomyces noursei]SHM17725.1 hydrogenase nickel incorporation protein HypA/HybF [Streptomyces yunnanensis]